MEGPKVIGVVNVTPNSFSDGGLFLDSERAIAHGRELVAEGADILDVGGESTRPGAEAVSAEEELARVEPVLEGCPASASRFPSTPRSARWPRSRSKPAQRSSMTSPRSAPIRSWPICAPSATAAWC